MSRTARSVLLAAMLGSSAALCACDGDHTSIKAHPDAGPSRDVDGGTDAADASAPVAHDAGPSHPLVHSELVRAQQGGSVEFGAVKLVIQPGALLKDTTISVTIDPAGGSAPENIASSLYRFGPAGTTFRDGWTAGLFITLPDPPADGVSIAEFVADPDLTTSAPIWFDKASSLVGATISAHVDTLGDYAVRRTICAEHFKACGGDLIGKWLGRSSCYESPSLPACSGVRLAGAASFESFTQQLQFFSMAKGFWGDFGVRLQQPFTAPLVCLGAEQCAAVADHTRQCSATADPGTCQCTTTVQIDLGWNDAADVFSDCSGYTSAGTNVTFHCAWHDNLDTYDPFDIALPYCVTGDTLRIGLGEKLGGFVEFVRLSN